MKKLVKHLLVSIFILELFGLFAFRNIYYWDARYLFVSRDAFRVLNNGLWTYKENSNILTAAVYNFGGGSILEYACKFKTNSLGLIDTNWIEIDKKPVLILGDSYTEGQGGCPWLTKDSILADKNLSSFSIVNGGLMGTGIQSFEMLERWLSKNKNIHFENVIVLAIVNDFKRSPSVNAWKGLDKCLVRGQCNSLDDYWWGVDYAVSADELKYLGEKRRLDLTMAGRADNSLLFKDLSFTYFLVAQAVELLGNINSNINKSSYDDAFDLNMKALARLKVNYPNLKLILIPQRHEVGFVSASDVELVKVVDGIKKFNINYKYCNLESSDFMMYDGHPNQVGYKKIRECLSDMM